MDVMIIGISFTVVSMVLLLSGYSMFGPMRDILKKACCNGNLCSCDCFKEETKLERKVTEVTDRLRRSISVKFG